MSGDLSSLVEVNKRVGLSELRTDWSQDGPSRSCKSHQVEGKVQPPNQQVKVTHEGGSPSTPDQGGPAATEAHLSLSIGLVISITLIYCNSLSSLGNNVRDMQKITITSSPLFSLPSTFPLYLLLLLTLSILLFSNPTYPIPFELCLSRDHHSLRLAVLRAISSQEAVDHLGCNNLVSERHDPRDRHYHLIEGNKATRI